MKKTINFIKGYWVLALIIAPFIILTVYWTQDMNKLQNQIKVDTAVDTTGKFYSVKPKEINLLEVDSWQENVDSVASSSN